MSFGARITASTQARPPLDPIQTDQPFQFIHINKCGGSSIEIALGLTKTHDTAAERRAVIGRDAWDAAYTFATVRNPFDRVASIYYYRVRTDQHGLGDRHLGFNAWVRRTFAERHPDYWDGSALLKPAADWISADGEAIVEHVARLEDIAVEWPAICRRLGVERNLKVTNQNSHPAHGRIFDADARRIIAEVFAEDLDRFGYTFETD